MFAVSAEVKLFFNFLLRQIFGRDYKIASRAA